MVSPAVAGHRTLPSTLHASLLARLDRLASVKDVAQIGAVNGREFSYPLIAAAATLPKQILTDALAQRGVPPKPRISSSTH